MKLDLLFVCGIVIKDIWIKTMQSIIFNDMSIIAYRRCKGQFLGKVGEIGESWIRETNELY